jgi:hypothetical protein
MICVRLDGGLGNQLFQYAAGRALALRLGKELLLDTSTLLRHSRNVTPRNFELFRFRHMAKFPNTNQARFLPWLHHISPVSHWVSQWHTHAEKGRPYSPRFQQLPGNSYLVGYWQSHKYFSEIAPELLSELTPAEPISEASQRISDQIDVCNSVALHIRRGDYVSRAAAASHHGVLPLSYYQAALNRVNDQVSSPRFFVFSDDPAWCRSNLPLNKANAVFVDHNVGPDAWQDLVLMSRCQHHVIANSSFSWWGAWLADQRWPGPQRLVVAPARWFGGRDTQELGDRFPEHWIVQK